MSKINALRIINLNYNNNTMKVNDETFFLEGESTLLSLRNGGGKSVLVQMIMAPFVHKRYRDAKDRPFESYFTTAKPTFILVEWALDGGAGYVLTGMMARKSQDTSEEASKEELELIQFIAEYKERRPYDIHHLPVVEKSEKGLLLKSFAACRQLFEGYKKDRIGGFSYYDMNNQAQSRQYFDRLAEYRIYSREWETIIKKVNIKESGLSDLFADARDEKGLVEKWFLDAVENKLNKEKNRIREFESIVTKYIKQYKENQSKIQRRDVIAAFQAEAALLKDMALLYQNRTEQKRDFENRIANFIHTLHKLLKNLEEEKRSRQEVFEALEEEIRKTQYQEISLEIYQAMDEKDYHTRESIVTEQELDNLERETADIEKELHILDCAKYAGFLLEAREECRLLEEKLEAAKKTQAELEPERNRIGGRLKHWYQGRISRQEELIRENGKLLKAFEEKEKEAGEAEAKTQEKLLQAIAREASCRHKIEEYDRTESAFNLKYAAELCRNIMGEYEPAALDIKKQAYEEEEALIKKELLCCKQEKKEKETELPKLMRAIEDCKEKEVLLKEEKRREEGLLSELEMEIRERRTIMKYLELPEDELYDVEKVLRTLHQKLSELSQGKRKLEQEYDVLEKERQRLTQGKVLELPKDVAAFLDSLEIHYIYGMDWLVKNGNSVKKNQQLIKRHPFIPYAIIVNGGELKKWKQAKKTVYTSFPVPIVKREDLEEAYQEKDTALLSLEKVSFFVMFNENLLDEKALKELVEEKTAQLALKEGQIERKSAQWNDYLEKREKIKGQKLTKERYENTVKTIEALEKEREQTENALFEKKEERELVEKRKEELSREITEKTLLLDRSRTKGAEFHALVLKYEAYLSDREEQRKLKELLKKLEDGLAKWKEEKNAAAKKISAINNQSFVLEQKRGELKNRLSAYEAFETAEDGPESPADAQDLEARYTAITERFTGERKQLLASLEKAKGNRNKKEEDLHYLAEKYGLPETAYEKAVYDRFKEKDLEESQARKKHRAELLKDEWNQTDKKIGILSQKIKDARKTLKERVNEEEPIERAFLQVMDFKKHINQKAEEKRKVQKELEKLEQKRQGCQENLSSLAEYEELPLAEEIVFEEKLEEFGPGDWNRFKGTMLRDYRASERLEREAYNLLVQKLNDMARMDLFHEDFFKKPIESLLRIAEDAPAVLGQLSTTLASYDNLMEKLLVDISIIEREEKKIVELLLDYVKETHQNLGKIDKNSTITIRERSIKMLKIKTPEWEENEKLYLTRLSDYLRELTLKGLEILNRNENIEEYMGTKATTRNLYDTVVGIGNVEIRLYKIEEQREYPISWADVSKNSGGEGFLSAFVILSSLLYYMRRDDADLFAQKEEGKVLLMDNPFAQTNSSHLLKPMMDMAKKTNTQLICLSGLGGDSIYNCFDNIYVLNLIAANLRNGMRYLKAEHAKGTEEEIMISSNIQVSEQMELLF